MVSTRAIKYKFCEGERVLCYEPDTTKAKVLYDSKVLGVVESKDKRGRRLLQYKIHFQGWNSSWDRRVNSDFVLKDTEENRQLQRDLAQKAQLQLAAYLYRKERKKRVRKENNSEMSLEAPGIPGTYHRGSSEDNSSCSTMEKLDTDFINRDDCDSESCTSSTESQHDEDRIELKISEKLKCFLDYDYDMIVKYKKQHILPARVPVVSILENFVKESAIKLAFSTSQSDNPRRRNLQLRPEKKEKELDRLINTITLLKEVADGIRVYFDFTLSDYLLYKNEKESVGLLLSDDNLQNFSYVASPDILLLKSESDALLNLDNIDNSATTSSCQAGENANASGHFEGPLKRKLRSYRSEDCDILFETCLSSLTSTSSGSSTPHGVNVTAAAATITSLDFMKTIQSSNGLEIPPHTKEYLQKVLCWKILPSNASPEPSMMFGATHLARLIIKLPDFLNASAMSDERLKVLIQHLDSFVSYLESHKEWFGEHNYFKECSSG